MGLLRGTKRILLRPRGRAIYYLAYDSFTRANADSLGSTETSGPLGGATARAWTTIGGDFDINGNAVVAGDAQTNLLSNPGFESGGTGGDFNGGAEIDDGATDNFANWAEAGVGGGDLLEATATVHAGSVALKATHGNMGCYIVQYPGPTANTLYLYSFWTRGDGAIGGQYAVYDNSNASYITPSARVDTGVTGAAYTRINFAFSTRASVTTHTVYCASPSGAGTAYFDDVSLLECHAEYIDVGEADAQIVWNVTTPASGTDPFGLILRRSGATMFIVQVTPGTAGTDLELIEINDGVPTVKQTADLDPSAATSYEYKAICNGTTIEVYVDGTKELTENSATVGQSNTQFGAWDSANSNATFEDVAVTAVS